MEKPSGQGIMAGEKTGGAAATAVSPTTERDRKGMGGKPEATRKTTNMADQPSGGKTNREAPSLKHSPFDLYKSGQGYWVRMGTAVSGGILIAGGFNFLFQQLSLYRTDQAWTLWMQLGVPLVVSLVLGYLLFWFVGNNRKSCDFMIATEGEMKKVSWSTRREIWGSTKVVIFFTLLMGLLLFVVDVAFWFFFSAIGVLKGPDPLQALFGVGS